MYSEPLMPPVYPESRVYIYVIRHPLTGHILYVGQTANVEARKRGHGRMTRYTPFQAFLQWCANMNYEPDLEIIATTHCGNADAVEATVIEQLQREGHPLLNSVRPDVRKIVHNQYALPGK